MRKLLVQAVLTSVVLFSSSHGAEPRSIACSEPTVERLEIPEDVLSFEVRSETGETSISDGVSLLLTLPMSIDEASIDQVLAYIGDPHSLSVELEVHEVDRVIDGKLTEVAAVELVSSSSQQIPLELLFIYRDYDEECTRRVLIYSWRRN